MRPIKFRVWSKSKQWMDLPTSISIDDGGHIDHVYGYGDDYTDGDFELMQFTSLHDKNGREIYEGDIVKFDAGAFNHGEQIEEVVFDKGEWCVCPPGNQMSSNGRFHTSVYSLTDGREWYDKNGAWVEVIGNKFENPELLEATK